MNELPHEVRIEIPVDITNDSGRPVYLNHCRDTILFQLEKQVESEWEEAYRPICVLIPHPPVEIRPGTTHREVVVVRSIPGSLPSFRFEEVPGTYRLRFGLHRTWDPSAPDPGDRIRDPLTDAAMTSNEFLVVR